MEGTFFVDPASPEQQAAMVLNHLEFRSADADDTGDAADWLLDDVVDVEGAEWLELEDDAETMLIEGWE